VISSEKQKKGGGLTHQLSDTSRYASVGWHSDITFETAPSDYAMLKIHTAVIPYAFLFADLLAGSDADNHLALDFDVRDLRPLVAFNGRIFGDPHRQTRRKVLPRRG
jgi:hypothetical protein